MKKTENWLKRRHKVVTFLLRPVFQLAVRLLYGVKIEKFQQQGDRP